MSSPWIKKYIPQHSSEIVGHPSAVTHISSLLKNWSSKSKPIFLWGDAGTGKTSTVLAFAKELNVELIEVNASDSRNKDAMETLVGGAIKQGSLFGTSKIILIDEVDGLSGTKDRGAIPELLRIIKGSAYPVCITAQDPFDKKFSTLRKACELVELKTLNYKSIAAKLKDVLSKEGISFEEEAVTKIAMSVGGDMRAALNDAQSFSTAGSLKVSDLSLIGDRDHTETIENALLRVFKTTSAQMAKGAFDNVDEDVNKVLLWLDHNIALEYKKPIDLYRGFDALAVADQFLGRIRRWQHYRFYVYAYDFLSAGVAIAKDEKYPGFTKYVQSDRILKIWLAKQKNMKKLAIAEKVAEKTHTSKKEALHTIPFLQSMFLNNPDEAMKVALSMDLTKEECDWLRK